MCKSTCGIMTAAILILAAVCICAAGCGKAPEGASVTSPDGFVTLSVTTKGGPEKNALTYNVTFKDADVVVDSPLGIALKGGVELSEGFECSGVARVEVNETYSMPYGKTASIVNRCSEAVMLLKNGDGAMLEIVLRAYDDGAAFKYRFPEQEGSASLDIAGELTGFAFTGNHSYWGLHLDKFTTSYETDYTAAALSNIAPESLVALPLLVEAGNNVWAAITEADLDDYAGMYLSGTKGSASKLRAVLSPHPDSSGAAVHAKLPHESPWRVIMLGDDPGRLVESNIVLNLNDPCAIDTSWIKPGRTAWDWWSGQIVKGEGFTGKMDNRTMKHYIDFAGDYGLEYMLVDAGWYGDHRNGGEDITSPIPEIDVPELVEYAKEKNVDIILWVNWRSVNRQMDEAFPLYESWDVKGVKVDYMNRDDQEMVNFYRRVVKKAAEHKLVVDFHGAYKPAGIRRTYPNLITREGVMGLEYVKWSARTTPEHDCILPFTRMLAGPMDYTPGGFSNATKEQFKSQNKEPMTMGTRCHQLALYVIFESPLQMLVDHPMNYRNKPGIEFLRNVPVTWDETRVLRANVGDCTVFARKRGNEWYMGSITDWTPREIEVPLDFLGAGEYTAEIYADGSDTDKNAESTVISTAAVTASDTMKIAMGPGGGHAVRFVPAK